MRFFHNLPSFNKSPFLNGTGQQRPNPKEKTGEGKKVPYPLL
jgi:hypothetical protein